MLNGLFGRKAGIIEGYSYTAANKNYGVTWDEAAFTDYIRACLTRFCSIEGGDRL